MTNSMIEFIRAIAPYAPVFGLMGLYLLVSLVSAILVDAVKEYERDIAVFWEEYRFFRSLRMAWRITVIRHKVRKVLHSGNLDAIRAELDAS